MAARKPLSNFPTGGGLKDLLSPSSVLEAVQATNPTNGGDVKPEKGLENLASELSGKVEGDEKEALRLKELGNVCFAKKDFKAAAEYYSQALAVGKDNPILYANRAQALLNQGRVVSALDDANLAVSLNPTWWKAYAKRAQACLMLGQFGPAVDAFGQALKLQPEDGGLKKGLAEAKAGLRSWEAKSDLRGISYPNWEETRAEIFDTIDIDKQVNISLPGRGGQAVSRETGLNYLHQAVIAGDFPLVIDLARLGAALNLKTSTAFPGTPLFLAITTKARASANPLNPLELAHRIPSLKGQALSEALEIHYYSSGKGGEALLEIAEYLLSLGADTEAKSAENDPLFAGMTPLAAAAQQKDWAACELLLQFGGDPKAVISGGGYKGRTVENLVTGEVSDPDPEVEGLMAGLSVVDFYPGEKGKPSKVKKVTPAELERETRERVSRFKGLVAKYENEARPPILCRCGSRVPILECHGRGLEELDAGTILRRVPPGAPCPCQRAGIAYEKCCWKTQDWVLDDDTGAVLNIVKAH